MSKQFKILQSFDEFLIKSPKIKWGFDFKNITVKCCSVSGVPNPMSTDLHQFVACQKPVCPIK